VNDAERLQHDPAMRWIVGGKSFYGMRRIGEPKNAGNWRIALSVSMSLNPMPASSQKST